LSEAAAWHFHADDVQGRQIELAKNQSRLRDAS